MRSALSIILAALSIVGALSASAQIATDGEQLNAEVAGFPVYLQSAIKDYSNRLIASADQFSEMDVSNCHFASDTTALIMQGQLDTVDEDVFLEWVVRSRGLGYLSLAKFKDHSRPLVGSYGEKVESGAFSAEEIIAILPQENARCTELLERHAGPVLPQVESDQGAE